MKNKKTRNLICSLLLAAVLVGVLLYIDNSPLKSSMLSTVLQKGAIYALLVVSMNLLNGFTGLFSLGQAGFMLLGAYTYAILTIPVDQRINVYQYFDGGIVQFQMPQIPALILAGAVAALFAALIGLPVEERLPGHCHPGFRGDPPRGDPMGEAGPADQRLQHPAQIYGL